MLTVTVRHHFSAGHRLLGLVGAGAKCANLHGHTFGISATFQQDLELAAEFTGVKNVLHTWVDNNWDHGYLVHRADDELLGVLENMRVKHYITPKRPTVEHMAELLAAYLQQALPGLRVLEVEVTEGPNNAASWQYEWCEARAAE